MREAREVGRSEKGLAEGLDGDGWMWGCRGGWEQVWAADEEDHLGHAKDGRGV